MEIDTTYRIPNDTSIGHVHLKVADIKRSLDFYCGLLGFDVITTLGDDAVFISAVRYHHHIGLNTWFSKNAPPSPKNTTGLYHTAILYPTRKDLAFILQRLMQSDYPINGASDHGVSEALYLVDPDNNGIELYWDKPKDQWPTNEDGSLYMYTEPLDLEDLLKEIE